MKTLLLFLCFAAMNSLAQPLNMDKLEGMKVRSIGPAGMSGRITAIDVVQKNPDIIYVGTASGGLWRSKSAGVAWEPVFDSVNVASIGALAIDQNNPDVIWVGTGEGNPRNSQTNGNGVYKSIDGGKTWTHLGLDATRNIHRLILDPRNSDVAYVGATGAAWGENPERGVFKTTDGGATWNKVLFVDAKTGVADLVMDPTNPNKLFCAMWQYRRWAWNFKSGGPGSGLYVSFDAGKTWKKRTSEDGLPEGELGRIGLAISRSSPNIIYALIEAKKNALYKSEDGGFKWKKVADKDIGNRPFYYAEIYVDPQNENRIYNLHTFVSVSEDGGKTFSTFIPWRIHPDHHALWISPTDPSFIIDGNDGGLAITHDRGKTWRFVENLPLGQFYHISIDNETPYNVYGGLQDNGSWRGPAYVWRSAGIRNSYWESVGGGDGFEVLPDRSSNRYCYGMSQGGELYRYDLHTGEQKTIKPIHPDGKFLRFNWNAGLAHDPVSLTTIYYGSQFLHKSTDRGNTWQIISPDLTTNDTSKQKQLESGGLTYDVTTAENHCTITAVAPSPLAQGTIWVGTDDGNVQLTQDGGKSWTNVVRNFRGVPDSTWVPQIYASNYSASEAFVVFENHRRNDWTPFVFHTKDFGKSWRRIVDEKKVWGYALSFAQDPVEPKLMFCGTEFGLYVSIDGGERWTKWRSFPSVSTTDVIIHPKEHDLVIGTFGRSVWVLDDIRPLRAIASKGANILDKYMHVFDIRDAQITEYKPAPGIWSAADAIYEGENRPYGAMISFVFNPDTTKKKSEEKTGQRKTEESADQKETKAKSDSVKIEILSGNEVVRTFKAEAKKGINRTQWNFDRRSERFPSMPKPAKDAPELGGEPVLPGKYKVRITNGKYSDSAEVNVAFDKRFSYSDADMKAKAALRDEYRKRVRIATEAADRLRDAKKRIEQIAGVIKDREDSSAKKVKERGAALQDSIKAIDELINAKEVQGIRRDPTILTARLGNASNYLYSTWEAPTETERLALNHATQVLERITSRINNFFSTQWDQYRKLVEEAKPAFFENYEPLKIEK